MTTRIRIHVLLALHVAAVLRYIDTLYNYKRNCTLLVITYKIVHLQVITRISKYIIYYEITLLLVIK